MASLTIAVDPDVLKRARMRAIQEGTSVNAVLRRHLEAFAGVDGRAESVRALVALARRARSRRGRRTWTRDELHER